MPQTIARNMGVKQLEQDHLEHSITVLGKIVERSSQRAAIDELTAIPATIQGNRPFPCHQVCPEDS